MISLVELVELDHLLLGQSGVILLDVLIRRLVPLRPVVIFPRHSDVGEFNLLGQVHRLQNLRDVLWEGFRLQHEVR